MPRKNFSSRSTPAHRHYEAPQPGFDRQSKTCLASGKKRYATKSLAERAVDVSSSSLDVELSVYQCESCRGWHLTSRPEQLN